MVTVTLTGRAPATVPRRARLSRAAVELLAARTGTPLPWEHRGPATPAQDPAAELLRHRLVSPAGDVDREVAGALAVLAAPDVLVEVDVSVVRPDAPAGFARLHSWQRRRGSRVASLSTTGGHILELGWHPDVLWQLELARAVTVRTPRSTVPPPAAVVDLPHELLLGSGAALRLHRDDVLADLVHRHAGAVRVDDDPVPAGEVTTGEQVRRLHVAALGRMRTVVAGAGTTGTRRVGWVSWVLYADGWRALEPHVHGGVARVRVHPVPPLRLGVEVARLVAEVRS